MKVGTAGVLITTVIVVCSAHIPASGVKVKVYVPGVVVLMVPGFHVPVIPGLLLDVPGRVSGLSFLQYGPNWSNVGTILGSTTIDIVVGTAH